MASSIYSTASASDQPKWLDTRSSKVFVTLAVSYAVFAEQFLFAVIVPVMPFSLQQRNGIPQEDAQYWVSVMLAMYAIAGCCLHYGRSRKTPFTVGLVGVIAATALLWLAPNIGVLIVARLVQGAAATFTWVVGLAVMVDTIGEAHIAEYTGYFIMALNLSAISAPPLGGVVFDRLGYHAVFYLTFGVIALDLVLRLTMIERRHAELWRLAVQDTEPDEGHIIPTAEAVLGDDAYSTDGSVSSLSADSEDHVSGLSTAWTLLNSSRLLTAFWGIFVQAALFSGFQAVLPMHVDSLFDWRSIGAGLIFLPLTVPSFLGPAIGKLADRMGARWPAALGFLLSCPALVLLRLVDHDSFKQTVWLCVLLAVVGLSITLTLHPLMAEITSLVSDMEENGQITARGGKDAYAQAYGLFGLAWSLGNMVGPISAGLVDDSSGWRTMSWMLGLMGGVSTVPVIVWCGGSIFENETKIAL